MRCPNCNHFYLFDNKYICPKCGEILDYQFKKDVEYFANKYGEVSYQFFDLADIKDLWNQCQSLKKRHENLCHRFNIKFNI